MAFLPVFPRRSSGPMLAAITLVLALGAPPSPAFGAGPKWVVIDPGHGGKDNGAYWGGVREKTLTLDLAKRVAQLLKGKGYHTTFTRTSDVLRSLDQRIAVANKFPNALIVSLHFNAHLDRSITGIETFYHPGSTEARRFATRVQSSLSNKVKSRNRGIKSKTDLKLLRKTKGTAILVECGFLSNATERSRCNAAWFRQVLAEAIVAGIIQHRG